MKTILLFMILLTDVCVAQFKIVNITPEIVCAGDSVDICFTIQPIPPNTPFKIAIYFYSDVVSETSYTVFAGVLSDLVSADTLPDGDKIYCEKFQIPISFSDGQWCAKDIIPDNTVNCILVKDCGLGINEINKHDEYPAIYFDVTGQKVKLTQNIILIEQRGNTRKKVIFCQ